MRFHEAIISHPTVRVVYPWQRVADVVGVPPGPPVRFGRALDVSKVLCPGPSVLACSGRLDYPAGERYNALAALPFPSAELPFLATPQPVNATARQDRD